MTMKLHQIFASSVLLFLVASSSLASDDHINNKGTKSMMQVQRKQQEQQQNMPMPGGYWPVEDYTDTRVVNAANMAFTQLTAGEATVTYSFEGAALLPGRNITYKIVKAFQQVVAGMNYRMLILFQDADTMECLGAFAVTVYDNFGTLSVTAWGQEVSCERAMANLENADDFESSATGEHLNGSS